MEHGWHHERDGIYTRSLKVKVKSLSRVRLFVTPWTTAYQALLSMEFSRQEYWSGCHLLLQGIFLIQGLNLSLLHYRWILYHCATWEALYCDS